MAEKARPNEPIPPPESMDLECLVPGCKNIATRGSGCSEPGHPEKAASLISEFGCGVPGEGAMAEK